MKRDELIKAFVLQWGQNGMYDKQLTEDINQLIKLLASHPGPESGANYVKSQLKQGYPEGFVKFLIHNTMEATTYSPLVYLKYQTIEEIAEHGGTHFNFTKEWHIDELYQYWQSIKQE